MFSDFDGTISAVVEDRERARPLAGTQEALAALGRRWAVVVIVSGRPVRFLQPLFSEVPNVVLVGVHGLERSRDGHLNVLPEADKWRPRIAQAVSEAHLEAPRGAEVEDKGVAMVLHCRKAPGTYPWAMEWALAQADATGLVARPGRLSVELLPPVPVDKGTVVEELGAGLEAVCYLGDDTSDLPAFGALHRMGEAGKAAVAVGVASTEQPDELPGAVDLLLSGPGEAVELLRALGR